MSGAQTVLEMRSLSVFDGQQDARYSLKLESGRIYALVGESGAGKTELFRIISGLKPAWKGDLKLYGSSEKKELKAARRKIGSSIGSGCYYPDLNAQKNLRMQYMASGKRKDPNMKAILKALNFTPITVDNRRMSSSHIEQKLFYGIVAAFINSPELLLLDTPLEGLSPATTTALATLLKDKCAAGMCALVGTRQLEEIVTFGVCDEYIFLDSGRITNILTAADMTRAKERVDGSFSWAMLQAELTGRGKNA